MRATTVRVLWDDATQSLSVEINGELNQHVDVTVGMRLVRRAMDELINSAPLTEQTTVH
jgi:hypothetical protein